MPPSALLSKIRIAPHPYNLSLSLQARLQTRPFTQSTTKLYPRKNAQDRESINTDATEYSKSGTDDGAAAQEEAAFDPKQTDPQQEKKTAGKGNEGGNPLDVSPANPEVSKQHDPKKGGAEKSEKENKGGSQSGGGRPGE